jgi:hypothetical protein
METTGSRPTEGNPEGREAQIKRAPQTPLATIPMLPPLNQQGKSETPSPASILQEN